MLTYYRKNKIKEIFKENYDKFNINLEQKSKNIFKFTINDYQFSFFHLDNNFIFDHDHQLIEKYSDWRNRRIKKFKTYQIVELNEELKRIIRKL